MVIFTVMTYNIALALVLRHFVPPGLQDILVTSIFTSSIEQNYPIFEQHLSTSEL